jgi:Fe-S cluster assembly protein SufD
MENLDVSLRNSSLGPRAPWLDRLRQTGRDLFASIGYPTTREEAWRYTNTAALARTPFQPGAANIAVPDAVQAEWEITGECAAELVFVNGIYSATLSTPSKSPGLFAGNLAAAMSSHGPLLEQRLGKLTGNSRHPFVAMNTGNFADAAVVVVPRTLAVERPVHLRFLSVPGGGPTVSHPRVLVVAEDRSQVSIVESYVGVAESVYFTNPVTEVFAGDGARIEYCKVQQESLAAYHLATLRATLGRSSYFLSHVACLGSLLNRNEIDVCLAGKGAEAMLNGLTMIAGKQHVDNYTRLEHAEPNCPSHELYKSVLGDASVGVFRGEIYVDQKAQKTDSKQTSRALLLSDTAVMHSQPVLRIYADDVKCTHGSTTGPLDEEQLFLLRSRGIDLEAARHLLIYAFLAQTTNRINIVAVRRRLEALMAARHNLPRDLRI